MLLRNLILIVAKPNFPNPIGLWNISHRIVEYGCRNPMLGFRLIRSIYRLSCACNVMELFGTRSPDGDV